MRIYLRYSHFPEIAELPRERRKAVYLHYVYPMLLSWPVRLVRLASTLLWVFTMHAFGPYSTGEIVAWITGFVVIDHLIDLAAIALHRSELRAAIHAPEPGPNGA